MKITIIGIPDQIPHFSEEQKELITHCRQFAGGERHFQLVKHILPSNHEWTNITVPLKDLFDKIEASQEQWIVFASGDPWFFGIANTLKREFPNAEIEVLSTFNSLQMLGHRLGINYGEYKTVTLTGRNWHEFDKALIQGENKLGILTDRKNTPAAIAQRMLTYGYSNYQMLYGEHLSGENEKVIKLTLQEALELDFKHPNCLFLKKTDDKIPQKLIPENEFTLLDNRPNMITKMPVRLATLSALQLNNKTVFWDVGACTGSVSIEAKLSFPHLKVTAFEIHKDRAEVLEENTKRFQCPGIQAFVGDYLSIDKEDLECPNVVFLGGYGGKMEEILDDVSTRLQPNGVIAFNSVSSNSKERFINWTEKNKYQISFNQQIVVEDHNPIQIIAISKIQNSI